MSENTKKGGVRAVPIVCAATVLAALIVVLFLVLYPSVMARRERTRLAERISAIADASDCAVLRTAMSDYGYGGTADGGEELVEGEQASAYARDLAARFMRMLGISAARMHPAATGTRASVSPATATL